MVVGVGRMVFRLHDCHSLKGKRREVKAMIRQIQNHFNASVAEVGANDIHQRAEVGFSVIGNDSRVVNAKVDKIFNMAEETGTMEMIDSEMEIIHL
jgi:uncharacterized protein YlxP (DUF503 family)